MGYYFIYTWCLHAIFYVDMELYHTVISTQVKIKTTKKIVCSQLPPLLI